MTSTDVIATLSTPHTRRLPQDGQYARHGAYRRASLQRALGVEGVRAAVDAGRLTGFGRSVLLDSGRLLDPRTRAAGALLAAGPAAVLVGPTAAALHGCPAVAGFAVHIRVPYYQHTRDRPGLVVHQGTVRPGDIDHVDGLPVSRLPVTLAEVLCRVAARRAALATVDQALHPLSDAGRAALISDITTALDGKPDTRGTVRARGLLRLATGRPASAEESALLLAVVDAGLPVPVSRPEVAGRHLALAWPARRVGVSYHRPGDGLAAARAQRLSAEGWTVLAADETDLADPTHLSRRLRTHLAARPLAA